MDFIQIMEWWTNLPQEQKEQCYSYMNGKKVVQKPFDKLKSLWSEWNSWLDVTPTGQWKSFEEWYMAGTGNLPNAHKILAEYCGFATTAEVRMAIQELKK